MSYKNTAGTTAYIFIYSYHLPDLDAASDFKALKKWKSRSYLENIMADKSSVTVAITPNGLADAVVDGKFVMPHEIELPFTQALDLFSSPPPKTTPSSSPLAYYIQSQNSNLTSDFKPLLSTGDIPKTIAFAQDCFNFSNQHPSTITAAAQDNFGPDAINLWIGDEKSVTSLHKDHFENIYVVLTGKKIFRLYPPTDFHHLKERSYPSAVYTPSSSPPTPESSWQIIENGMKTPWISFDPLKPSAAATTTTTASTSYPSPEPIIVTVNAGDMFYLPAMWYHHVSQVGEVLVDDLGSRANLKIAIAVNYWYDMDYSDSRFSYFQMLRRLSYAVDGIELEEEEDDDDDDK